MTAIVVTTRQCCDQNRRLIAQSRDHSARSRRLLNRWWGISGGSVEPPVVPTDGTSTHWPLDELERLVRDKLRRGALFVLTNGKVWAGPATGRVCRVCSQTSSVTASGGESRRLIAKTRDLPRRATVAAG